jgi:hypothetical protein
MFRTKLTFAFEMLIFCIANGNGKAFHVSILFVLIIYHEGRTVQRESNGIPNCIHTVRPNRSPSHHERPPHPPTPMYVPPPWWLAVLPPALTHPTVPPPSRPPALLAAGRAAPPHLLPIIQQPRAAAPSPMHPSAAIGSLYAVSRVNKIPTFLRNYFLKCYFS